MFRLSDAASFVDKQPVRSVRHWVPRFWHLGLLAIGVWASTTRPYQDLWQQTHERVLESKGIAGWQIAAREKERAQKAAEAQAQAERARVKREIDELRASLKDAYQRLPNIWSRLYEVDHIVWLWSSKGWLYSTGIMTPEQSIDQTACTSDWPISEGWREHALMLRVVRCTVFKIKSTTVGSEELYLEKLTVKFIFGRVIAPRFGMVEAVPIADFVNVYWVRRINDDLLHSRPITRIPTLSNNGQLSADILDTKVPRDLRQAAIDGLNLQDRIALVERIPHLQDYVGRAERLLVACKRIGEAVCFDPSPVAAIKSGSHAKVAAHSRPL